MLTRPFRLIPEFHPKVWGSLDLQPWFPTPQEPTGEVWFTGDANRTELGPTLGELTRRHGPALLGDAAPHPHRFPLLVKFLFTSAPLSVQVHPGDEYAAKAANSPGKTEMWHVLRATPQACLALGFREPLTASRLREAALSGEIEQLLQWLPARAGDTFFTPAGTVHALGGGLALCEIQQNSDITYRLYDYGRPRPLHLDDALAVADLSPPPPPVTPQPLAPGRQLLVACPWFHTEQWTVSLPLTLAGDPRRMRLLISLAGVGMLGDRPYHQGEVWLVPPSADPLPLQPESASSFLLTYVP